ncbi:MAG: hypothetical protein GY710_18675 [Desulfobacteraceae bacterium]|nr:hypothetical protein [Desulfobacteraceae bacterium]
MKKLIFLLSLFPMLLGCSTVEKRVYFSPEVEQQFKKGPKKPSCGWANFGGLPDEYIISKDSSEVSIFSMIQFLKKEGWSSRWYNITP